MRQDNFGCGLILFGGLGLFTMGFMYLPIKLMCTLTLFGFMALGSLFIASSK